MAGDKDDKSGIWLRLMPVNELYGDEMVRIAHHWLNTQPLISNAVLLQAGFSPPHGPTWFLTFSPDAGKNVRWLEHRTAFLWLQTVSIIRDSSVR